LKGIFRINEKETRETQCDDKINGAHRYGMVKKLQNTPGTSLMMPSIYFMIVEKRMRQHHKKQNNN
jgi:hypothetical protein